MSLFLRKACQERLDNVGLENYHVQVDDITKCLQIVGECGDTLVSITGIRLSRMAPPNKEIDLAVELFDDFLAKHTGTFKEFIAAKITADTTSIPQETSLLESNVAKPSGRYNDTHTLTFAIASYPDMRITVKSNGSVLIPAMDFNLVVDPDKSIRHSLSSAEQKSVRAWIKACDEFNTAMAKKKSLLEILSYCEI